MKLTNSLISASRFEINNSNYESRSQNASSHKTKYSVFIGCISGRTRPQDIINKYSEFANIFDIKLRKKGENAGSGYGTFSTDSLELYQFLITMPQEILGRKVTCRPDLKGEDRRKHLDSLNNRRIYIKGVNPQWTDEQIFQLFHVHFPGKVERAYAIRNVNGKSEGFGYVNFSEVKIAKAAIRRKWLMLEGFKVECRPYSKSIKLSKTKRKVSNNRRSMMEGSKFELGSQRTRRFRSFYLQENQQDRRSSEILRKPHLDFETKEPLKCTFLSTKLNLYRKNHLHSNLRLNY